MQRNPAWRQTQYESYSPPEKIFLYGASIKKPVNRLLRYENNNQNYHFSLFWHADNTISLSCTHALNFTNQAIQLGAKSCGIADEAAQTYTTVVTDGNKEKIRDLIDLINRETPLEEIKESIYCLLGLQKSELAMADEISQAVQNGEFQAALKKGQQAQALGYHKVSFKLAQRLDKDKLVSAAELIQYYQSIPKTSPYYKKVNLALYSLYTPTVFPESERDYLLRQQLEAAVNSEAPNLIEQTLHRLHGHTEPKSKDREKSVAEILFEQAKKNTELQLENQRLKAENEHLKSTKKTEALSEGFKPKLF